MVRRTPHDLGWLADCCHCGGRPVRRSWAACGCWRGSVANPVRGRGCRGNSGGGLAPCSSALPGVRSSSAVGASGRLPGRERNASRFADDHPGAGSTTTAERQTREQARRTASEAKDACPGGVPTHGHAHAVSCRAVRDRRTHDLCRSRRGAPAVWHLASFRCGACARRGTVRAKHPTGPAPAVARDSGARYLKDRTVAAGGRRRPDHRHLPAGCRRERIDDAGASGHLRRLC